MASPVSPFDEPSASNNVEIKADPQQIIRSQPYFDDGNIILAVEQTHFRVYRGVLKTLSPIFADMLAMPQPPSGEIFIDGCPVIELTDAVEDWEILLNAYFLRRYFISFEQIDHDEMGAAMIL